MPGSGKIATWDRLSRLRRQRRAQTIATLGLVILGPTLALVTFLILGPLAEGGNSPALRLILLADMVYILVVAALVAQRIVRMVAARRARSAGSRLHLRLTGVFAFVALVPTVLVAIIAVLTVNFGLEGWFSDRVREVISASLSAAETYEQEHRRDLTEDAEALAVFLNEARGQNFNLPDGDLRQVLVQGQGLVQRGLREAYIIDGSGEIRVRGDRSYLFDFEPPEATAIETARAGETVLFEDWENNELRALVSLAAFPDRLLYVSRRVDGDILLLLDDTQETAHLYQQLESDRGRLLFEFGLLYLGFALILILAAVWLGLWFAERLSRPVGRLAGAAQQVGAGDLGVQVIEEDGDDEIAMLGRLFNQMTRQLKGQRENLLEKTEQIESRRRLFDSVLSSVSAGVIGLDRSGRITFINTSAKRLLSLTHDVTGQKLTVTVPEFSAPYEALVSGGRDTSQDELKLIRGGSQESLLVRMSRRRTNDEDSEGVVIAFDDVTELVTAQRLAAWGDVARRIAHEIKNPLTPIQLSAERLKRKYAPMVGDEAGALEQYTDVIVRQTNDLRRIVDEFAKFARMPAPERRSEDIAALLRDSVALQQAGQPGITYVVDIPDGPMPAQIDATLLGQALTNLLKNAGEAIANHQATVEDAGFLARIEVKLDQDGKDALIRISDNGIGLPQDRARLFEPYVTHREGGTGLGLSIVKKIIEDHGGRLRLEDAEPFEGAAHFGACAVIELPDIIVNMREGEKTHD